MNPSTGERAGSAAPVNPEAQKWDNMENLPENTGAEDAGAEQTAAQPKIEESVFDQGNDVVSQWQAYAENNGIGDMDFDVFEDTKTEAAETPAEEAAEDKFEAEPKAEAEKTNAEHELEAAESELASIKAELAEAKKRLAELDGDFSERKKLMEANLAECDKLRDEIAEQKNISKKSGVGLGRTFSMLGSIMRNLAKGNFEEFSKKVDEFKEFGVAKVEADEKRKTAETTLDGKNAEYDKMNDEQHETVRAINDIRATIRSLERRATRMEQQCNQLGKKVAREEYLRDLASNRERIEAQLEELGIDTDHRPADIAKALEELREENREKRLMKEEETNSFREFGEFNGIRMTDARFREYLDQKLKPFDEQDELIDTLETGVEKYFISSAERARQIRELPPVRRVVEVIRKKAVEELAEDAMASRAGVAENPAEAAA